MTKYLITLLVWCLVLSASQAADRFPFVIPGDDAARGTATDMSALSPRPAGADGFVHVRDGTFHTDSARLRIWGVNLCFGGNFPRKEDAGQIAAHLQKLGINGMRFHHHDNKHAPGGIWKKGLEDGRRVFDPEIIDRLDYFLAQLHRHGIYANLNLHCSRELTPEEGFPRHNVSWPTGYNKYTMYFDPGIQEALKQFCRDYLLHTNPYRKLRRVDDPGIAMMELTNENAFGTRGPDLAAALPQPYRGTFKRQWNQWLKKTYRSDEELRAAWGEQIEPPGQTLVRSDMWTRERGPWSWHGSKQAPLDAALGQPGPKDDLPAVRLNGEGKADKSWEQQLMVGRLSIRKGRLYTLRFWYRSERPRPVSVDVAVAHPKPWKDLGVVTTLDATTEWRRFETTFYGKDNAQEDARLCFNLGGHEGDVWLADVTLQKGGRLKALPEGQSITKGNIDIPVTKGWAKGAVADVKAFMRETEVAFTREMMAFLKEELGVRVPVSSTQINYLMPGVAVDAGMDYADLHAYWQHPLFPVKRWDQDNWIIRNEPIEAHPFLNKWPGCSMLARAGWRLLDRPFTFSEWNSGEPMIFGASLIPTAAMIASLQDWDAIYFFQYEGGQEDPFRDYFTGYFSMNGQPVKLAMLTACANLFRRGDLAALSAEAAGPLGEELVHGGLALTHKIGKRKEAEHLPDYTPPEHPRLESPGDQVAWDASDPDTAHIVLNTPATRGAWGRIAGKSFTLGEFVLTVGDPENDYASIILTSLDGRPLESSNRVLLAAAGSAENTGMQWNAEKTSVGRNWGAGPSRVNGIPLTIALPDRSYKIYALDGRGQRVSEVEGRALGPEYRTLWYEIVGL